jgi:hypothetical protein
MHPRHNACWFGLLAAAVVFTGQVPVVRADDPSPARQTWFRFWSKPVPEAQKDSAGKVVTSVSTHADPGRRLRAEMDWKRRAEICQKFREIAASTGDADLERFAERLDQRAWEAYLRHTSSLPAQPLPDSMHGVRVDIDHAPRTTGPGPRNPANDQVYEVRP